MVSFKNSRPSPIHLIAQNPRPSSTSFHADYTTTHTLCSPLRVRVRLLLLALLSSVFLPKSFILPIGLTSSALSPFTLPASASAASTRKYGTLERYASFPS